MYSKSKLKSKKTTQSLMNMNEPFSDIQTQAFLSQFIEVGAICGDGTFTENTGRGAGSHHNGIRHKLYARRTQLYPSQKTLTSKVTTASSTISYKLQQPITKDSKQSTQTLSSKKKSKKISLKQTIKTKTKKSALYQKIHYVFETLYKDSLQIIEQQLDDELWLVVASVCNLYDELEESMNMIRQFESTFAEDIKRQQSQEEKDRQNNSIQALTIEVNALKKQNKSLNKEIEKLLKNNNHLSEELEQHKFKQRNFKKMLKVIERHNPKVLINAVQQSRIDPRDLKRQKKAQSKIMTRSMLKKQSKAQQKKIESLFSSDDQPNPFDEDNTIVGLIKGMK